MNPLLEPWTTPYGLPPFDKICDEHWEPAFRQALAEAKAAIRTIVDNPEPPSFQDTIVALELADRRLSLVSEAFWLLANADSNPAREALDLELAPKLSSYRYEITSNKALFGRIDALRSLILA